MRSPPPTLLVIHCASEQQARDVRDAVARRLADVGLEIHPGKTRIVYCKDSNRTGEHEHTSFTFLSYTFRPREAWNKKRQVAFTSFQPAASREKVTEFSRRMHDQRLHRRTSQTLNDLAVDINPVVAGWLAYFAVFYSTTVIPLCERIDHQLVRWAKRKYKRLKGSDRKARVWLEGIRARDPELFAHWKVSY